MAHACLRARDGRVERGAQPAVGRQVVDPPDQRGGSAGRQAPAAAPLGQHQAAVAQRAAGGAQLLRAGVDVPRHGCRRAAARPAAPAAAAALSRTRASSATPRATADREHAACRRRRALQALTIVIGSAASRCAQRLGHLPAGAAGADDHARPASLRRACRCATRVRCCSGCALRGARRARNRPCPRRRAGRTSRPGCPRSGCRRARPLSVSPWASS